MLLSGEETGLGPSCGSLVTNGASNFNSFNKISRVTNGKVNSTKRLLHELVGGSNGSLINLA